MSPDFLMPVIYAVLVLASVSAVTSFLSLLHSRRSVAAQAVAVRQQIETGIRVEVDRLRSESIEHARALRQEVGDSVRGFQGSILEAFKSLGTQQVEQLRSFGEALQSGFRTSEERTGAIAQRVADELLKIATSGNEASERLRIGIETKLDQFGEKSVVASRELREEVSGGVKTLHESVTLTLDTRIKELTTATTAQSQAARSELSEGLKAVGTAVTETLQQISTQQRERLNALGETINAMSERQTQGQETLRTTVEGRLDAIRTENLTKLEEMRKTVDEKLQTTLEARLGESFRLVSQQLESVHKGLGEMQSLAAGVGDLKKVMTNVKIRGTWGEIQLGNLLEQFLSPEQYLKNAQVKDDSMERVEFALRLPGRGDDKEVLLPIDAKFPQEDFSRLVAAAELSDALAVEAAAAALEARIKNYAKSIREKYINSPVTTDFAILFLPTESLYAEMLRRPGLFEHLQHEYHVTLSGPTTLAALLNAYQMGFRSIAIEKRSSEVWKILGAVRSEFEKHGDVVNSLRKQLGVAVNTIDKLGTRTRAISKRLKDVEILPQISAPEILALTNSTDPLDDDEENGTHSESEVI